MKYSGFHTRWCFSIMDQQVSSFWVSLSTSCLDITPIGCARKVCVRCQEQVTKRCICINKWDVCFGIETQHRHSSSLVVSHVGRYYTCFVSNLMGIGLAFCSDWVYFIVYLQLLIIGTYHLQVFQIVTTRGVSLSGLFYS